MTARPARHTLGTCLPPGVLHLQLMRHLMRTGPAGR